MSRFVLLVFFLTGAGLWLSRRPEPVPPNARQPKLPVYFIENRGQLDARVSFYVNGRQTAAYFTPTSVLYSLSQPGVLRRASVAPSHKAHVQLEFPGANPKPELQAVNRTEATVSYFHGPPDEWKTGLATYSALVYRDLWPGIDLEFTGPAGHLKYTFHIRPGADPRRIRLAYRGAKSVRLTAKGSLHVETAAGGFADERPVAWQDTPKGPRAVAAAFQLEEEQVRFQLGAYDPALPLTLDPVVLLYAGFLGGSSSEQAYGIAVDSGGNAYVTGYTLSHQSTFPVVIGPDLTLNGNMDAFVAKVNAAGTALLYAGFLGGTSSEQGNGIAVDAAGNAYVTGYADSDENTFPVTAGPDLSHNGGRDAFVAKINATGTALVYCGFIGGSSNEAGQGIAVDGGGNAYVTGYTLSGQSTFPVVNGPDVTQNGATDAFVAKINATGTALLYSGFIGGSSNDGGQGIAVDGGGSAYVTGYADSTQATFPVLNGPDLTHNGGGDAFVAKVAANGTALLYSGFIGGSGSDGCSGIAVDGVGNAYVVGSTQSTQATFPVLNGPDVTQNGSWDVFVAKVSADGTTLFYSGFIGGSDSDGGARIAVDAAGNAYVTGETYSTEASFPVLHGPDLTFNGSSDAFAAKINASGSALVYAGYIGGSAAEHGWGIAIDPGGNVYVGGDTQSSETTFPVLSGPDSTYNGSFDGFVAKIGAFPSTAGPVLAFRNGFNAIETNTFPASNLRNSGGSFRLNPALAMSGAGTAFVAGRDSSAGVWINFLNPDESYHGWLFAGGNSPGQPALAEAGGTAWIAVRDSWNSYSVRAYHPATGFAGWTWLQGIFATDPQIAGCPNGDVYVAGKDSWNGVWTRRYNASLAAWQAWRFIGGIISGAPSIACASDNAAYVGVRDPYNNMWLARVFQESEVAWNYGQGLFDGDLQVAANRNQVHVVGLSAGVPWYRTWQVGTGWLGWTSPGGVLTHLAPAVYGGQVFIAGQTANGDLWWWSSLSNAWTNHGNRNVAAGSGFSAGAR